ncbi:dihydrofolate reductase [Asanoa ferruginea]|uniref:Dihydrofolate reductase n=1 Tax=Asanoa ferruginea TaxID=53367 RepID=A0A3D9ZSR5_9ACTN|nr:dihydrofolate reductase family protein [Asanoa ferruginea]REG00246.1 dihydrofolate reductase [Asanoa ferruginea]GIF46055.1 deaminase reductase [Asanoa ferruginea]
MAKIIISQNITLDGVVQDPTGEGDFDRGGWFNGISDADRTAWAAAEYEEALAASAMLLGRRSYDYFATRWADRPGDWADRLRELPKYVISTTLQDPQWPHTTVLPSGDALTATKELKETLNGEIVVYASLPLARTLIENDLADEVRLMVYPTVLGAGDRLFGETSSAKPMRLVDARTVGDSLAFLTYRLGA